jgi:hypothetical protein
MPLVTSRKPLVDKQDVPSPPAAPSSRASMAAAKAAGRQKLKEAAAKAEAEERIAANAGSLWPEAFDFVFDSASDPKTCGDFLVGGRAVLVVIPGFSSWASFRPEQVEAWQRAALLASPEEGGAPALSLVFKWPCGAVKWSSVEANVEAAAAYADAFEATALAATNLTRLLRHLVSRGSRVVLAAHNLGARVALQALSNDLAAPKVDGLILLGGMVDNYALCGLERTADSAVVVDGQSLVAETVPAEFPFLRLMKKCSSLSLVQNGVDPALTKFWPALEYGRTGRKAPPPIGLAGPILGDPDSLGEWADRVILLDVTEDARGNDPISYLLTPGVAHSMRECLFTPPS